MKYITFRRQKLLNNSWKCQRSLKSQIVPLQILDHRTIYSVCHPTPCRLLCHSMSVVLTILSERFAFLGLGAIHSHMWMDILRSGHLVRIRVYRDRHFILNWRPKSRETFNGSQRGLSKSARSRSSSNPPETDPILKLRGHHYMHLSAAASPHVSRLHFFYCNFRAIIEALKHSMS